MKAILAALAAAWAALVMPAHAQARRPRERAELETAWSAWRGGDFAQARQFSSEAAPSNEALHLQSLASAATGDHAAALAAYRRISPRYPRLRELDEAMLWAHVWLQDISGAQAFAARRDLLRSAAVREQMRIASASPLRVALEGVVELPFTSDGFSAYMPGVAARLNGRPTIARLDTGGSFIHMSRTAAAEFGVSFAGCEQGFAALTTGAICHGKADLDLGAAMLRNVPVSVHEDRSFPAATVASVFGAPFGVVIGTNVFRQFLTTVDAPAGRLILSRRGDAEARAAHFARLPESVGETPFGILSDHYIIAHAQIGAAPPAPFFVDSGLAAFNLEQGQAALLASESTLARWRARASGPDRFAELPEALTLGPVSAGGLTAMAVPDRMWRDGFGAWSGVSVEALVSHGFLKRWPWTLDFDGQRIVFHGEAA